ncbi:MAG: hypothetical protein HY731_05145 [Candidatus Tectomicrobia bacterium]|nr:hypothetical protein [Candidatus Tectomicrobia bacterium]
MEKRVVSIHWRTRNVIFPKLEKDQVMMAARGRIRHDYRQNRYLAGGDLDELAQFLRDAGYEVELIGRPAVSEP